MLVASPQSRIGLFYIEFPTFPTASASADGLIPGWFWAFQRWLEEEKSEQKLMHIFVCILSFCVYFKLMCWYNVVQQPVEQEM